MMITFPFVALVGAMMVFASVYSFVSTFSMLQGGVVAIEGRITAVDTSKDKESSTVSIEFAMLKNGISNQIKTSSIDHAPPALSALLPAMHSPCIRAA
jgi:hypothetical protein